MHFSYTVLWNEFGFVEIALIPVLHGGERVQVRRVAMRSGGADAHQP
jgi:hypothetical protein